MERKIKVLEESLTGAQEEADKARADHDKLQEVHKKTLVKEGTLKKADMNIKKAKKGRLWAVCTWS